MTGLRRRRLSNCAVVVSSLLGLAVTSSVSAHAAGAAATSTAGMTRYRFVAIPALARNKFGLYDEAGDVNKAGTAVGFSSVPQASHAIRFRSGKTTDLGTLGSSATTATRESQASAISSTGVVVGTSQIDGVGDEGQHAFIVRNGVMSDLGTGLANRHAGSSATDVNDAGEVVGIQYAYQDAPFRAVAWVNGRIRQLPGLGGTAGSSGTTSEANAVNNSGVIAGAALPPGPVPLHAVIWRKGVLQDLGNLGGTTEASEAFGINGAGVVVGTSQTAPGAYHAFTWFNGTLADIGALPRKNPSQEYAIARAVNAGGVIVGSSETDIDGSPYPEGLLKAVIWHGGHPVDLNRLVDGIPKGRELFLANAISDNGYIVGRTCVIDNCGADDQGFLLVPIT